MYALLFEDVQGSRRMSCLMFIECKTYWSRNKEQILLNKKFTVYSINVNEMCKQS